MNSNYDTYTMRCFQRILDLVKQKGLLRTCDLEIIRVHRRFLAQMTVAGLLEKVDRGLYRLPGHQPTEHDRLAIVSTKVPQSVFCLLTALQIHELITQPLPQIWIAMPNGNKPRISGLPIRVAYMSRTSHSEDVETVKCNGIELRVYGIARTLVDCFKYRNKIGLDATLEALGNAYARKKVSVAELWRYAEVGRVLKPMRPYLKGVE